MNKKIFKLRGLFSNTKFLVVFSIVIAILFWIIVALEFSPIVDNTIKDVPVSVNLNSAALNQFGLQGFGADNFSVDITVKGKRYVVGVLKPDDFILTADTASVDTAGKYVLQIKAVPKDNNADYEIMSLSSQYIEVYFDKLVKNVEVPVEPRIVNSPQQIVESDLTFDLDDIIVTQQTVTLSGAKSEIEKIKKVYADIDITQTMSVSTTVDAKLHFEDDIKYVDIQNVKKDKNKESVIPVYLCIYKDEKINTEVEFINAPSEEFISSMKYTLSYSNLVFSVLQSKDGVEIPEKIAIGEIDFSKISPSDRMFNFTADEISEYVINNSDVDNGIKYSGDINSVTVMVDTSNLESSGVALTDSNLTFSDGDKSKYKYDLTPFKHITVVGPKGEASLIKSDDIEAVVQTSDISIGKTEQEVPVLIKVKDGSNCWIYGNYYIKVSLK